MPNDLSLDQRLRDSEGMDLMAFGLEMQKLSMRGREYPQSTEAPVIDQAVRDLTASHFLATRSIPLWLRSCGDCKGPKEKAREMEELCLKCQERAWDEEAQWRGEEQDRKRFEHSTSI